MVSPRYNANVNRRNFLGGAAAIALENSGAQVSSLPIIDTHIHLFDPTRPQGVPWPPKENAVLYKPAMPDRYRKIAAPLGIVGAIEIEASAWLEDNQWVLDVAKKDKMIVGTVGHLEPGKGEFRRQLDRFQRNPLFRGIRYGNLWGTNLDAGLAHPDFVASLKALADAGLEMDTANPNSALMLDVLRTAEKVPNLRIVIDHLLRAEPPIEPPTLRELGQHPNIYVKVSGVLRRVNGAVPEDLNFYKPRLDEFFEIFGEDRLIYGSDWPNSDQWAPYPAALKIIREYFTAKGQGVAEKVFWKNSIAAYRWVKRDASQPDA